MIIETTLGFFGVLLGVLLWWSYGIRATLTAHSAAMVQAIGALENLHELAESLADQPGATDEMLQVLSEMHVPTGQDHIQAAIATGMNMLFAKMLGGPQVGNLLGGLVGDVAQVEEQT